MMTLELPRKLAGPAPMAETQAWRVLGLSHAGLSRFLKAAQTAVGLQGEVGVLLTGDRELRRLNREFRGQNKATDVLSFPAFRSKPALHSKPPVRSTSGSGEPPSAPTEKAVSADAGMVRHAGDLAISLETAQVQADEHGHSLRDELRVLLLHGLLHLAGMDHETDRGEMAAREAALRRALRLPSSLIARAATGTRAARTVPALRNPPRRRGDA